MTKLQIVPPTIYFPLGRVRTGWEGLPMATWSSRPSGGGGRHNLRSKAGGGLAASLALDGTELGTSVSWFAGKGGMLTQPGIAAP